MAESTSTPQDGFLLPQVAEEQAQRAQEARERALANLDPFVADDPRINRQGRQRGGLYVSEWINLYLSGRYTRDDLEEIAEHSEQPAQVIAAQQVLMAMKDPARFVLTKRGDPVPTTADTEPGRAFDRIMDRVIGKPVASVHITRDDRDRDMAELQGELEQLVSAFPMLEAALRNVLALPRPLENTDGDGERSARENCRVADERTSGGDASSQ